MPMDKQASGPTPHDREKANEESQYNKPERVAAPGRRVKSTGSDNERTPGAGALPSADKHDREVDPGTG